MGLAKFYSGNGVRPKDRSRGDIAFLRWFSLVVSLRQPTGHWFSCQMADCHWSLSVARTNEDNEDQCKNAI